MDLLCAARGVANAAEGAMRSGQVDSLKGGDAHARRCSIMNLAANSNILPSRISP
jgi:hypothetical protein